MSSGIVLHRNKPELVLLYSTGSQWWTRSRIVRLPQIHSRSTYRVSFVVQRCIRSSPLSTHLNNANYKGITRFIPSRRLVTIHASAIWYRAHNSSNWTDLFMKWIGVYVIVPFQIIGDRWSVGTVFAINTADEFVYGGAKILVLFHIGSWGNCHLNQDNLWNVFSRLER